LKGPYGVTLWTEKETQFLIDNYELMPASEIARHLNRDLGEVYGKVCALRKKGTKLGNSPLNKMHKPKTSFEPSETWWIPKYVIEQLQKEKEMKI